MFIPSNDWKIQKKLLEAGGLGPVVYIYKGRASCKQALEREDVNELLKSGRTVVYGLPESHKKLLGSRKPWILPDRDILTPEQYERAERIWNEFWKGEKRMKIKIESERWWDIGDMIRHYPQLGSFGFEIEKRVDPQNVTIKDADGSNVTYEYGCICKYIPYIHVDTVEDIFRLGKAVKHNIVFHDDQNMVVIADDSYV